ncbi:hypothetical protein IWZ03DRAFT_361866 [Phyllosticta citriasiana]|uniref:Uncharacterized protein n=1 Tax=Phyllosticta citriasiana TaxID=595635 RepID=A0ABR1KG35_9PEZI
MVKKKKKEKMMNTEASFDAASPHLPSSLPVVCRRPIVRRRHTTTTTAPHDKDEPQTTTTATCIAAAARQNGGQTDELLGLSEEPQNADGPHHTSGAAWQSTKKDPPMDGTYSRSNSTREPTGRRVGSKNVHCKTGGTDSQGANNHEAIFSVGVGSAFGQASHSRDIMRAGKGTGARDTVAGTRDSTGMKCAGRMKEAVIRQDRPWDCWDCDSQLGFTPPN